MLLMFLSNIKITQQALKMQEVSRENLIPGKEYYLQCFAPSYAPPNKPIKMIGTFKKLFQCFRKELTCFINFRKLEHRNDPSLGRPIKLVLHWRFYEINGSTIQKTMENRVYKQVIIDIIGDEWFTPIEVI